MQLVNLDIESAPNASGIQLRDSLTADIERLAGFPATWDWGAASRS
jgi:hypothetical protein